MTAFLNDIANDDVSTQKIENDVIIDSLKSETIGKLINRIPGSFLVISSLPGKALRTLVVITRLAVIIASLKSKQWVN